MSIIPALLLETFSSNLLQAWGTPCEEAALVSRYLVAANLAGHDSHGVLRLPDYLKAIDNGRCMPGAETRVIKEAPAMAVLDAGWNFGQVAATRAAEIAIRKAHERSAAIVTVQNANHVGRMADYCRLAAKAGCIGIMTTNGHGTDQDVAPFGGSDRRLPTNPIGVAFPTGQGFPFVLDMTTSVVATGKLKVYLNEGRPIPLGWIVDGHGRPTTNPSDFWGPPPGCALPLGGHKGFGLGLALDVLAGALSEAGCTRGTPCRLGNGVFFQAICIEAFTTMAEFLAQVDRLIAHVKASPLAEGAEEILVPGEASFRREKERLEQGLQLDPVTWKALCRLAESKGLRCSWHRDDQNCRNESQSFRHRPCGGEEPRN